MEDVPEQRTPYELPRDTSYLSEEDRRTLGEDQLYRQEILERRPTVFIRPGDRTMPECSVHLRSEGFIGFIKEYGSHAQQKPAIHLPDRIPIRIVSQEAKKISNITMTELTASLSVIRDARSPIEYLEKKYKAVFTPDSVVTLYHVEYLESKA